MPYTEANVNDQQRNAIAMALMNIAQPPPQNAMPPTPQMPQPPPQPAPAPAPMGQPMGQSPMGGAPPMPPPAQGMVPQAPGGQAMPPQQPPQGF